MIAKCFEVRDRMTFIPVCAVSTKAANAGQLHLLRRSGYISGDSIILINLNDARAQNDPYAWGGRTMPAAHLHIEQHFSELVDGAVVDVEFILGETLTPKKPEEL